VETADELALACQEHFGDCDVLVMAAAVADFKPAKPHAGKLKKAGASAGMALELEATVDVLAGLGRARTDSQVLIGFAAEHGDGAVDYGRGKLERKRLDAIVINDVSRPGIGFESSDNEVTIVTATEERHVPRASKRDVAAVILDLVGDLTRRTASPSG
jgi:phosphopantothenoylcysteine decarboxylase/phosphopantothenate--cysteine ligase